MVLAPTRPRSAVDSAGQHGRSRGTMPANNTGGGARLQAQTAYYHRAIIAIFLLIGVGLGAYYALSRPPAFTSSAPVLIQPITGNAFAPTGRNDELTTLETEAQIVRSDAVLGSAAAVAPGRPT